MTEEKKKQEEIPRLEQTADGEVVDNATGQCACCKDKFR